MKTSSIRKIEASVTRELDRLSPKEGYFPMPPTASKKISCHEWQHWVQRLKRQRIKEPNYDKRFCRLAKETVDEIWALIDPPRKVSQAIAPPMYKFMDEIETVERMENARCGFIMTLSFLDRLGIKRRRVTFMLLVDVLARAFSPSWLLLSSTVSSVCELSKISIEHCRRDLILQGVLADRIWDAALSWKNCPLLRLEVDKHPHDTIVTPRLRQSPFREKFLSLSKRDRISERWPSSGLRLLISDDCGKHSASAANEPSTRRLRRKICGEQQYDLVLLNEISEALLRIQEDVLLYFSLDDFLQDYANADRTVTRLRRLLLRNYGVRAYLSTKPRDFIGSGRLLTYRPRDSEVLYRSYSVSLMNRERRATPIEGEISDSCMREVYAGISKPESVQEKRSRKRYLKKREKYTYRLDGFKRWLDKSRELKGKGFARLQAEANAIYDSVPASPEALWLVDQESRQWRMEVRALLNEYDAARLHLARYAEVWEQIQLREGYVPIRTRFEILLNRRFQPLYLWPTHVTARRSWSGETQDFKEEGEELGSDDEVASLRQRWFRYRNRKRNAFLPLAGCDISSSQMQILAVLLGEERLEQDSMNRKVSFKEYMAATALHCSPQVVNDGYEGSGDERLQRLVKELLMRVSYGSPARWVAIEQWGHPLKFGPGWTKEGAENFMKLFGRMYPKVETFRKTCSKIGELASRRDPYGGVQLHDPASGLEVRWNPVKKEKAHVDFGKKRAYFLVPVGGPNEEGDCVVDEDELCRMIMPCLVQMLDAYYSGLVMRSLREKGCRTFVGIHDCWLVPRSKLQALKEAMEVAAREWYSGLGSIYGDLLRNLQESVEHTTLIQLAQERWSERVAEGYAPVFRARWDKAEPYRRSLES